MREPDGCRWLPGARLNIAYAALTSPLAPPDAPAILWAQDGSPQQLERLSWLELRRRASHVAECARQLFAPGGRPAARPLLLCAGAGRLPADQHPHGGRASRPASLPAPLAAASMSHAQAGADATSAACMCGPHQRRQGRGCIGVSAAPRGQGPCPCSLPMQPPHAASPRSLPGPQGMPWP